MSAIQALHGATSGRPNQYTVNIYDNAMSPTAGEGDFALIDMTKGLETGAGIFLFQAASGDAWIRRIQMMIDGTLNIISDNVEIENELIHRDQVDIIGRVEWIARKV